LRDRHRETATHDGPNKPSGRVVIERLTCYLREAIAGIPGGSIPF
jgi:hypothetical protein